MSTALNLPLIFARLSEGQIAALHAVDGFLAGVETRGGRPLYYGPTFQKLMNSVVELVPPANDDADLGPVPPNPGPEAKPAEHGAPPVAAPTETASEQSVRLLMEAAELSARMGQIRKELEHLVPFAIAYRADVTHARHVAFDEFVIDPERGTEYLDLNLGWVRRVLTAAGMFTDEMRPPETAPVASAEQAEVLPPPPAPSDEMPF